jgi:hypothetical protein
MVWTLTLAMKLALFAKAASNFGAAFVVSGLFVLSPTRDKI